MKYKLIRVTTVLDFCESKWKEFWWRKVGFEAADKISKESSEFGTQVHSTIGDMLCNETSTCVGKLPIGETAIKAVDYIRERNIQPLFNHSWEQSLEVEVKDDKLGLVGHFDLAANINGVPYIVDFKTGSKMKNAFALQLGAYAKLANSQFAAAIHNGLIIRTHWNKETKEVEFEVKEYTNLIKKYWKLFNSCLIIYKFFTRTDKQ